MDSPVEEFFKLRRVRFFEISLREAKTANLTESQKTASIVRSESIQVVLTESSDVEMRLLTPLGLGRYLCCTQLTSKSN